jgi:hypothetical protein
LKYPLLIGPAIAKEKKIRSKKITKWRSVSPYPLFLDAEEWETEYETRKRQLRIHLVDRIWYDITIGVYEEEATIVRKEYLAEEYTKYTNIIESFKAKCKAIETELRSMRYGRTNFSKLLRKKKKELENINT